MKTRVVLVDDHTVMRQGLRLLLESQPDLEVVGEAGDGLAGLAVVERTRPDVILMDISMPGMDGLEAIRQLAIRVPESRVLALTGSESDDAFFLSLEAGASGYIVKGADASELLAAIRTVAEGNVFLHPIMTRRLLSDYTRLLEANRGLEQSRLLTDREREVLQLMSEGYTNREIAARLVVSASTVQTHRTHIMEKLNLSNRVDLISYAIREGLLRRKD